jgi:hypothetical protein
MISHSATTEATEFPDSIGIEPGANYHTVIEIEAEQKTFNPLEVLGAEWNKQLYALFTKSSPGSFARKAQAAVEQDKDALVAITNKGILVPYYLYCMEYVFSVLKWTPQGVRR